MPGGDLRKGNGSGLLRRAGVFDLTRRQGRVPDRRPRRVRWVGSADRPGGETFEKGWGGEPARLDLTQKQARVSWGARVWLSSSAIPEQEFDDLAVIENPLESDLLVQGRRFWGQGEFAVGIE